MHRAPDGIRWSACFTAIATTCAVGALLAAFYGWTSASSAAEADLLHWENSIFDMDPRRIVRDWTSPTGSQPDRITRTNVHPLYKLFLAPIGSTLAEAEPGPGASLRAARIIAIAAVTLTSLLAGVLAAQLCDRRLAPGLLAALLSGVSFSSVLLANIPETAAVAGISALAPLLLLGGRVGRDWRSAEGIAWGAIGIVAIAFTVTQLLWWVAALGVRIGLLWREARAEVGLERRLIRGVASAVAICTLGTLALVALQRNVYPDARAFQSLAEERSFSRLDDAFSSPVKHTTRLLAQFLVYDFAPPFPGYADLARRPQWSLSFEESGATQWTAAQRALSATVLLCVVLSLIRGRPRADPRFIAPGIGLGLQLLLHFAYGREYVLYSGNWHGVLSAVIVALGWRAFGRHELKLAAVTLPIIVALAANSAIVIERVYYEVAGGMGQADRDETGALPGDH